MNQKKAKKIRKLVNPQSPISRRVYQRLKKAYSSIPSNKKQEFLDAAEFLLNNTQKHMEQKESRGAMDQEDQG
jgi:hypothetical protein